MTSEEKKKSVKRKVRSEAVNNKFLILHNDDTHTFDYVIDALIEICNHNYEQAAQCTLITHYKGKCDIKKGVFEDLKPLKNALVKRKLIATID